MYVYYDMKSFEDEILSQPLYWSVAMINLTWQICVLCTWISDWGIYSPNVLEIIVGVLQAFATRISIFRFDLKSIYRFYRYDLILPTWMHVDMIELLFTSYNQEFGFLSVNTGVYHKPLSSSDMTCHFQWCLIYTDRTSIPHDDVIKWKHFPRNWPFVRGIHRSRWIPRTKASDAELWCFLWSASE